MRKKYIMCALLIVCMIVFANVVQATGFLSNIINQGTNFDKNGSSSSGISNVVNNFLKINIIPMIGAIGNLIFAAVTVVLGAKYIWSSAEGRADVLESLPTFVIAVVFFYLAGTVFNLVDSSASQIMSATSWDNLSNYIIFIINRIIKYVAFGGVVFIGIKYMLASAEGKASVKTSLGGVMLGLLLACSATQVIEFIVKSGNEIL